MTVRPQFAPHTPSTAARRPLVQPLWDDRVVRWLRPHQLQLRVPMLGWSVGPRFGLLVGEALTLHWLADPLPGGRIASVVAHCTDQRGRPSLTVLITFEAVVLPGRRIDGPEMARAVRDAAIAAAHDRLFPSHPG